MNGWLVGWCDLNKKDKRKVFWHWGTLYIFKYDHKGCGRKTENLARMHFIKVDSGPKDLPLSHNRKRGIEHWRIPHADFLWFKKNVLMRLYCKMLVNCSMIELPCITTKNLSQIQFWWHILREQNKKFPLLKLSNPERNIVPSTFGGYKKKESLAKYL